MKTKNIFRMLLLAVALIVGDNKVESAETVIWDGTFSPYSAVAVGSDKCGGLSSGQKLRVYVFNRQLHLKGGWNTANFGFKDSSDGFFDFSTFNETEGCFEAILDEAAISRLTNMGSEPFVLEVGADMTVTRVTYVDANGDLKKELLANVSLNSESVSWPISNFGERTAGDVIRIYTTFTKAGSVRPYGNNGKENLKSANNGWIDCSRTDALKGYIDIDLSDAEISVLKDNYDLYVAHQNIGIKRISISDGDDNPAIPTHTLTISIDGQMQTKTVAEGTVLTNVLPTPTKEGYTFTGWSGIPESGNMPTNDLTVTAQFSINSYKLTYKVDGEVYGDVETIEYGAAINPRTAPTKDGFSFSGWNGLPETMPAHDVEVTGEFTGIKYKVEIASTTYGVITTDKEAYEKGETVTVTIKDNTGYEMESISTDPTNLGLQRVDDGVFSFVMPDADVMVTVRFKAKEYTLTFMLNNEVYEVGEIPQIYQVRYGTSITLPADPAQEEGYTFSGWSGIPADGKMPAGDLIVYGHFNAMLSVGSTGYATYCPTRPVIFQGNEDIKAYIAKEKSDSEVTLIQVIGAVAAGTGLVLIGEAGAEVEFEVTNEGTDYSNENLMIGVTGASANIHASNLYVLVQKEDGVKFADTAANAATVPVGKAYLQAPVNSSRILTICFGDESTGMETVHASTNKKVEVYNLSGQRIANPRKGLYIVNGKKAFIK